MTIEVYWDSRRAACIHGEVARVVAQLQLLDCLALLPCALRKHAALVLRNAAVARAQLRHARVR